MIRSQVPNRFIRCLCRKRNDALLFSLAVFVALAPPKHGHAGTAADPSGHWEGAIHAPSQDVTVSVDLALGRDGKLAGTVSNPGEHITGYPLAAATMTAATCGSRSRPGAPARRRSRASSAQMARSCPATSSSASIACRSISSAPETRNSRRLRRMRRSTEAFVGEWTASLDPRRRLGARRARAREPRRRNVRRQLVGRRRQRDVDASARAQRARV